MVIPPQISHGWWLSFPLKHGKSSFLLLCLLACLKGNWMPPSPLLPSHWPLASLLTNQEPIGKQDLSIRSTLYTPLSPPPPLLLFSSFSFLCCSLVSWTYPISNSFCQIFLYHFVCPSIRCHFQTWLLPSIN